MKDLSPLSVVTPAYKIPAMVLTNSGRLYQWTRTMSLVRTWEKHILDCSMNECMDCKLPFGTSFFIKLVVEKRSNLNKHISFAWLGYRNLDGEAFL
jgi:hypothetical protein